MTTNPDRTETGPTRKGSTERCANPDCGHTKRDHSGRRDHTTKHPNIPLRPWCHACETDCLYEPPIAAVSVPPPAPRADDRAAVLPSVGIFATLVRERADHIEAALGRMRDRLEVTHARVRRLHAPSGNGECQHCHHDFPCPTVQVLDADIRRAAAVSGPCVAGEQQNETPEEAHPPTHTWKVESPRRDKWASWGATYDERDWASERYESAIEHASGRAFRLVRATTTYTVEAEHTPAVEASE